MNQRRYKAVIFSFFSLVLFFTTVCSAQSGEKILKAKTESELFSVTFSIMETIDSPEAMEPLNLEVAELLSTRDGELGRLFEMVKSSNGIALMLFFSPILEKLLLLDPKKMSKNTRTEAVKAVFFYLQHADSGVSLRGVDLYLGIESWSKLFDIRIINLEKAKDAAVKILENNWADFKSGTPAHAVGRMAILIREGKISNALLSNCQTYLIKGWLKADAYAKLQFIESIVNIRNKHVENFQRSRAGQPYLAPKSDEIFLVSLVGKTFQHLIAAEPHTPTRDMMKVVVEQGKDSCAAINEAVMRRGQ